MEKNSHLLERALLRKVEPKLRFQEGQNFAEWQETAYQKLWELLGMDSFASCDPDFVIEWEREQETCHEIRFHFSSEEGYRIPAHILLPKGIKRPVPVICLQGHSRGMVNSLGRKCDPEDENPVDYDRDFAARAVREGFAAIAMEQRYMGECSSNPDGRPSCDIDARTALLFGRCAIGERVWDVMRLVDLLEEQFSDRLDLQKLICLGNSGGGTATFYASCMEKRIRTAVPSCSVCTYRDSIGAMYHCLCNYIPHISEYFDMGDLAGLLADRQLIITAGKEDEIFPIGGVRESFALAEKAFAAAGNAGGCRLVVGEGGHRFYADQTWKAYRELNSL